MVHILLFKMNEGNTLEILLNVILFDIYRDLDNIQLVSEEILTIKLIKVANIK